MAAIKARGDIVVAWPHDGLQHDRQAGESMAAIYKKQGLRMLDERATFPDGATASKLARDMLDRMQTGRSRSSHTSATGSRSSVPITARTAGSSRSATNFCARLATR